MGKLISEEAEARVQQQELREREREEDLARKNYNFLQLEKRTVGELKRLTQASPKAATLLYTLAERMNKQNAIVMSQSTMQSLLGWSRPTISAAIKLLKEEQWLQVLKIGTANAYIINSRVFWQSTGNLKHTVFNAQIIASASEQSESFEELQKVKLKHFPFAELREANEKGAQVLITGTEPPPDQQEMDV